MSRDYVIDEIVDIATGVMMRRCPGNAELGAELGQEVAIRTWQRLQAHLRLPKEKRKERPVSYALWGAIRDVLRGERFIGGRIAHEKWERKPRAIFNAEQSTEFVDREHVSRHQRLPLCQDDFADHPTLVNAQEYRLEMATDDADVIDAQYAA